MKILVTGANGQLGSELTVLSKDFPALSIDFTDYPGLDITNHDLVDQAFAQNKYDYCINCAAYTAVDKAEQEKDKAEAINAKGVEVLADACKTHQTVLIHISTDFVFDGMAYKPLDEHSPTNSISYYGLTKQKGEDIVISKLTKFFIFRTSWLYSSLGNNFVKTMLKLSETKDELNIIADQVGTPTYARDLASVILKVITEKNEQYGLYHYSNEGIASWYDFAKAVFDLSGVQIRVNPIPTSQYPTPAKRPHYSVMDKSKAKDQLGLQIPYWRDSLKECLRLINQ